MEVVSYLIYSLMPKWQVTLAVPVNAIRHIHLYIYIYECISLLIYCHGKLGHMAYQHNVTKLTHRRVVVYR